MLAFLGLTPLEESIYNALLGDAETSSARLADELQASASDLNQAVGRLVGLGLVTRDGTRLTPVAPQIALEALLVSREKELATTRSHVAALNERWRNSRASWESSPVEMLTGREAIAARYEQLLARAQKEFLELDRPPYSTRDEDWPRLQSLMIEKGLVHRVIYNPEVLAIPKRMEMIEASIEAGEEARALHDLPLKLAIVDGEWVFLPWSRDEPTIERSVVIQSSSVADAFALLFERLWQAAHPIALPLPAPHLSESDRRILLLLVNGFTDDAIASQQGVSLRTAQRRISTLMTRLDARSRFQAGAEAAKRGWIP